jgi:transposase-like protein
MSRKPRVRRTPEEKWQIALESLKSGNVAEICRKFESLPIFITVGRTQMEAGGKTVRGGRSTAAQPDVEQEKRIKQLSGPWASP